MKLIVPTVALSLVFGTSTVYAQTVRERTIEEIKIEAQARAERGLALIEREYSVDRYREKVARAYAEVERRVGGRRGPRLTGGRPSL